MRQLRAFILRLLHLLHLRPSPDAADELEAHIAFDIERRIAQGLAPAEARRQAILHLGGIEQARQSYRNRQTLPWLDALAQDTRYAFRTLRRTPGFTLTAILTLALGIGACTAIFSLVNAVLLRSLPYGDPARLVYLFTPNNHLDIPAEVVSPGYADLSDIRQQTHSYQSLTAFEQDSFSIANQGSVQRIGAARVDANFFSTLQSTPEIGRAITAEDTQPGHDKVAIISHAYWLSAFGGAPDILNRSLTLDVTSFRRGPDLIHTIGPVSYRIIGVMPAAFTYPSLYDLPYGNASFSSTQLWLPLVVAPASLSTHDINDDTVIARLRPGVTPTQAQSELATIMARLDKLHPPEMQGWGALVKSFLQVSLGPIRPLMRLLLGAVFVVLLIACGNAANLLLARASGRMRELGIRVALGAGRRRVIRQLLTESLLLGLTAGALGIALAFLFLRLLPLFNPGDIPRLNQASLDSRVLLFTLALSLLTSLITGLLPAIAISRTNLIAFLAGNNTVSNNTKAQSILITLETALVVVLLASAGLLLRSYIKVASVDTGFAQSTLSMHYWISERFHPPGPGQSVFIHSLIDKLNTLPGVSAAATISNLPLSNSESLSLFQVEGYPNREGQLVQGWPVTPRYFSAMNIPLIAGRLFTDSDRDTRPIIVNQRFAQTYLANRNPIGARISTDEKHWQTIIGVVGDVHHTSLEKTPGPQMYSLSYDGMNGYLVVRSSLPPSVTIHELRTAFAQIDPSLAIADISTMSDLVSDATARRRFQTSLLTAFSAIALILALVGLYGLMAYTVTRRTREVGIRIALGAQRSEVLRLILGKAARLIALGLLTGLAASFAAARILQSFLFGISPHDPITLLVACTLLTLCGLAAALIPARHAASIDPMQALRTE
jgi:putative ABC transport system permease protein